MLTPSRPAALAPVLMVMLGLLAILSCALQGDYPAPALGVLVDGNLAVVELLPGSAAERAGVQAGDVLVALNGNAYASVDDWRAQVSRIDVGHDYDLEIRRGGQVLTLRVTSARPPPPRRTPGVTPTAVPTDIASVRLLPAPRFCRANVTAAP